MAANDGSPESLDAALVAGEPAARYGSTAATLHVGETRDRSVAEEAVALMEASGPEPVMHRAGLSVSSRCGWGWGVADVMGSRGRTGLAALGSVSERVVHHAGCSVLIVRRPAHPAQEEVVAVGS